MGSSPFQPLGKYIARLLVRNPLQIHLQSFTNDWQDLIRLCLIRLQNALPEHPSRLFVNYEGKLEIEDQAQRSEIVVMPGNSRILSRVEKRVEHLAGEQVLLLYTRNEKISSCTFKK